MIGFLFFFFIFLTSCPSQAAQAVFRVEEMMGSSHRMYKRRRIVAVEAFQVAEKNIKDLKTKLTEEGREREKKKKRCCCLEEC